MIKIQGDTVVIDKETTRLEGFRMEDTVKAPVIILFVDEDEPKMIPLEKESTVPVKVKSKNSESEIQIIGYDEIKATLTAQ